MAQYYAQGDEGCRFSLCLLYAEPGTDWISMETAVLEAAAKPEAERQYYGLCS